MSDAAVTPELTDLLHGFSTSVALVVGGHGGVGSEITQRLMRLNARVIAASRRVPWAGDAVLPGPGESLSQQLDVTDPGSIARLAAWLEARTPGLDLLFNAAGITRSVALQDLAGLDDATIDAVVESNATGPLKLIRGLEMLLRRGRDPVIVTISSVAARTGVGSNIAYVGAKAAMDAMSISLAKALAPQVRIVNVAPSALATDFAKGRGQDFLDRTIAATPLKRLASPGEVANAALCAARLLTATTGTTIFVDGGRHL